MILLPIGYIIYGIRWAALTVVYWFADLVDAVVRARKSPSPKLIGSAVARITVTIVVPLVAFNFDSARTYLFGVVENFTDLGDGAVGNALAVVFAGAFWIVFAICGCLIIAAPYIVYRNDKQAGIFTLVLLSLMLYIPGLIWFLRDILHLLS